MKGNDMLNFVDDGKTIQRADVFSTFLDRKRGEIHNILDCRHGLYYIAQGTLNECRDFINVMQHYIYYEGDLELAIINEILLADEKTAQAFGDHGKGFRFSDPYPRIGLKIYCRVLKVAFSITEYMLKIGSVDFAKSFLPVLDNIFDIEPCCILEKDVVKRGHFKGEMLNRITILKKQIKFADSEENVPIVVEC